ncbi:hypothetical protein CBA19CS91_26225 [Paraburkholderia hospita]|nr:hypothetical protein CBA19CS91_26225 [Paraburkholderia hospita]
MPLGLRFLQFPDLDLGGERRRGSLVREGFSRDLDKLRETAERLRASEKRVLLEIDRERGAISKLQKEADQSTKRAERCEADHRRAVDALQAELGDARHRAGMLQGRLETIQAAHAALQSELNVVRRACVQTTKRQATSTERPAKEQAARRVPAKRAVKRSKQG